MLVVCMALAVTGGCNRRPAANDPSRPGRQAAGRAMPPAAASPKDDGQWIMPAKDFDDTIVVGKNGDTTFTDRDGYVRATAPSGGNGG